MHLQMKFLGKLADKEGCIGFVLVTITVQKMLLLNPNMCLKPWLSKNTACAMDA